MQEWGAGRDGARGWGWVVCALSVRWPWRWRLPRAGPSQAARGTWARGPVPPPGAYLSGTALPSCVPCAPCALLHVCGAPALPPHAHHLPRLSPVSHRRPRASPRSFACGLVLAWAGTYKPFARMAKPPPTHPKHHLVLINHECNRSFIAAACSHKIRVMPGPDGTRQFIEDCRLLLRIPEHLDFDVVFHW